MPNELTCTSFSFPLLDFERSLQAIALLDIGRFDVGAHEGASHVQPSEVEADPGGVADRIKRAADAAGLGASDFFPTFGHGFRDRPVNTPDPLTRASNLARFRAIVTCARAIGAGGVTLLPGVVWPELGQERSFELATSALEELLPIAHDAGLRLSVEAHLESVAESPALAAELCEAVPGLRLTLDYSHFVAGGHSAESVHPLVRHAGHFHARQAGPGRLQAGARDGSLDFPDIVGRLRGAGYAGDYCVEYTWQEWRDCWHQDVVSESIVLRDLLRPPPHVMARVTTGTGDDGYTGLIGPGRVPKHHPRVELLGTIDEATGALGLARAHSPVPRVREVVPRLQRELYRLMAEVATTADRDDFRTEPSAVDGLETLQAELQSEVEIPSAFVIPGATASSAALDLARAIVRRAERQSARLLHEGELTNPETLRYLNRCSDLLHVLARFDEVSQGVEPQTQG